MSEWAARRFWKDASVEQTDAGFAVLLDGRAVRTPAKTQLVVPSEPLADAIAAEWRAQGEKVDPLSMPNTRSANAALDKVTLQRAEVVQMLADYGDADLLCYRADGPDALVARQAKMWDPMLDWVAEHFGARLSPRTGIMHAPQAAEALGRLKTALDGHDVFGLTALHDLVSISGSLVLGLAVSESALEADQAWELSRLDEIWQEEQWGADEEAQEVAARKKSDFLHAATFYRLSQQAKAA